MTTEELKKQLKEKEEAYKSLKQAAYHHYLDPIDFPEGVKSNLRRLSREKVNLKNQINYLKKQNNE